MAIFSRSTREEMAGAASPDRAEGDHAVPIRIKRSVGQLLREARQGFGREIPQVGSTLRIRGEYLEAIETGQYEVLPGPTYAIGFIRTYADYLGLDGAEIVRRFKQETEGLELRRDLTFPMPLTERSIPGGTILLVALILALCGYGIWYYLSSSIHARIERVGSVPGTLLPPTGVTATPETGASGGLMPPTEAAAAAQATGGASPRSLPPIPVIPAPSASAPAPAATPSVAASAPSSVSAVSTPAASAPAPSWTGERPPATASSTTVASPGSATTVATALPPTAISPLPPVPQPTSAAQPSATPAAPVPTAPQPQIIANLPPVPAVSAPADPSHVFGATTGPARIVIRATGISWIQVHDAQGSEVFTRVMKAGDVYRVPDKPGLQLHTGSAGSLEVSVDGKIAPSLGTVGVIRHTVVLDPQRLLAGTAVEN
ncbi:MAG TPA: RodZ domain-containing protein [Stellaceae bacterium]|nr:RodZ domain-containing protein [Stellaceae bacterium]